MAEAAIDEAVRNVVCVGADVHRLALLDNFCWPGTDYAEAMGSLVGACEACRDIALAYGTPFISGKDSLHNQFTDKATGRVIKIPPTLLISALGIVEDIQRCCTSDLKTHGEVLWLVRASGSSPAARIDLHRRVAGLIQEGRISAAHDVSDGGWLVAAAEMCIGGGRGLELNAVAAEAAGDPFAEPMATYLLCGDVDLKAGGLRAIALGRVTGEAVLRLDGATAIPVAELARAWRAETGDAAGIGPVHAPN
jgi:phosphoribosylformylglycinamidine synthase